MLEILWHSTVALNLGHTAEISKELKTKIYCRSHPQSPILTFAGYILGTGFAEASQVILMCSLSWKPLMIKKEPEVLGIWEN